MRRIVLWLNLLPTIVLAQGHVTDYAPQTNVPCPDQPLMRVFTPQNQSLNPQESAYISTRESTILPAAWGAWLGNGSALGYNLTSFTGNYPRIGIAISGGGLRGAQYGAGVLSGLDARNDSAKAAGAGGLLQVSSYMTALSGELPPVVGITYGDS
jgi:lysophospholipase